jgi:integrase
MLTDAKVKSLRPKAKRYEVADGGRNGLVLRVTPAGVKSWVLRYRIDGRPRRCTLGTYPQTSLEDARMEAAAQRGLVRENIDPGEAKRTARDEKRRQREAERTAATMETLCSRYLELYAKPNKKSWREDERQINLDVLPRWKNQRAREITRGDVQSLLDAIAARGAPVGANRMKALLSRVFRWALARGYVELNPVAGIELPARERPKDRVLSEAEVRLFWNGLDKTHLSEPVKRALRLILATAQRPGEVAGLRFEEIQEHGGRVLWTIPGDRRKSGETHVIPLSELALELLGDWQGRTGFVFEGPPPRARGAAETAPTRPVTTRALGYALRRNVGEPDPTPPQKHGKRKRHPIETAAFSPHDLRRTAATLMSGAGVAGLVKPMLLGHAPQGITQAVYDRFAYMDEKAHALESWGRRLRSIVTGEEAPKVVQLRGGGTA